MASINQIKLTIGGAETTPGTAVSREYVIPIRGVATLDKTAEKQTDPAIVGANMIAGEYLVADNVTGNIPLSPRACGGFAQLVKSALGTEETPVQVGACIRVRYTGSEASCKLVPSASGDTLTSSVGDKGSESADSNFGTSGTIDLTAVATDTVGELVTEIDGYTDYECEKLFGADSVSAADILDYTTPGNYRQAKSRWAYIWFSSTTSGVYRHEFTPDLSDTERPTYSIQKDGYQDNFLYAGCVVNNLNLSAALKAMVEGDADILGMSEASGQSESSLSLEDIDPLVFYNGGFTLGENEYTYIRNMSLAIANNHNEDGYGQGSTSRLYQQKGITEISGDMQVRLDATAYAERAKIFNNTVVGLSFYFKGKTIAESLPEAMLIELPYASLSTFEFPENNGVFDAKIAFKALSPKGTNYDDPLTITLLTTDSGAY